jgi:hypothetical protein
LAKLDSRVADLAAAAFAAFQRDPEAPVLHNHALDDCHRGRHQTGSRAVWVSYRYRAIYVVDGDTNVWYWIGTHEDYNIFTGRK